MRFHVPRDARVLEIGSGSGDLLAALQPSRRRRRRRQPGDGRAARAARIPSSASRRVAGEELELGETFDYIVLSDLMPYVHDLLELFQRVAAHSHERTRVVINSYSRAWRPVFRLAELLRLKPRKPIRNWVSPHDVRNLLELAGFEPVLSRDADPVPEAGPVR